jgi:DNA-binding NarL/FixJ family response regulator
MNIETLIDNYKDTRRISSLSPSDFGEIVWLHRSGWSDSAIAKRLRIMVQDVEAYLSMNEPKN